MDGTCGLVGKKWTDGLFGVQWVEVVLVICPRFCYSPLVFMNYWRYYKIFKLFASQLIEAGGGGGWLNEKLEQTPSWQAYRPVRWRSASSLWCSVVMAEIAAGFALTMGILSRKRNVVVKASHCGKHTHSIHIPKWRRIGRPNLICFYDALSSFHRDLWSPWHSLEVCALSAHFCSLMAWFSQTCLLSFGFFPRLIIPTYFIAVVLVHWNEQSTKGSFSRFPFSLWIYLHNRDEFGVGR